MPTINKRRSLTKRIDIRRQERQDIYQTDRWKKLREAKLMTQPLCEICLNKGLITPATQVHHVDSFMNYQGNDRLFKAFDANNLQCLCETCHSKLHSMRI